jgi:hypothetical protein
MVAHTSTEFAPWTVVAGNDKHFARVQILKTLCEALERLLLGSSSHGFPPFRTPSLRIHSPARAGHDTTASFDLRKPYPWPPVA